MAFWRKSAAILACVPVMGILIGCTPASQDRLDEEKDPHVVQGRNQEAAYDYARAIESYHRALEANPRNSIAHERLGLLYESEDRDPAAAIYHFQQFLKLRPNAEIATVIRQRILGCKQELAKEVALGPVSGEMQHQLNELIQKNQRLAEESQRLGDENRQLKELIARLQTAGSAPAVSQPDLTAPPRISAAPSSSTPSAVTGSHTVQKGQTYYSISRQYGVTPAALAAANPNVDPNRLQIGQRLKIPSR